MWVVLDVAIAHDDVFALNTKTNYVMWADKDAFEVVSESR
jgi:hypothetical protein